MGNKNSDASYDDLLGRKRTLTTAIDGKNEKKAELEGKISRLKKSASILEKNITNIEDVHSKFADLSIDESRWKGKEKDKFKEQFQSLKENTKSYLSTTEKAKEAIEEELSRCEENLLDVESQIEKFEDSLKDVQSEMTERTGAV